MSQRISDLASGSPVNGFFAVSQLRTALTKNGSEYWSLTLQDVTGSVGARVWSPASSCPDGIDAPGIYWIQGRAESWRDELQVVVEDARPYQPSPDEFDALVACSRWSPDTLRDAIVAHLDARVREPDLRRFLHAVLADPDVTQRFFVWPAASGNHHAFRSGLAEHTLSMLRLASSIADHYAGYYPGAVDGELLLAGVLLHDLGKIWELEAGLVTSYTDPGRLVGHIPMGAAFVHRIASSLDAFPDPLLWQLQHLVLSHHGEYEYGSPKRPKTIEAQLLHFIDNIDAKTNIFASLPRTPGWTQNRSFGRPLHHPARGAADASPRIDGPGPIRTPTPAPETPPTTASEPAPTAASGTEPETAPTAAHGTEPETASTAAHGTEPTDAPRPARSGPISSNLSLFDGLD